MRFVRKRNLRLAALLAALIAAGSLLPLAYRNRQQQDMPVAAGPAAPGTDAAETATPPAPPGTEVVPPEESETDRGPASASPAGPTLSFARAAGLHLAPDPLRLNSSAALVVDQDSGEVLMRKNDQAVLPIASLTKLMTTLLVTQAKQPMDEVLTITEDDVDNERHSRSRLKVGTSLTRQEALHLALMSSENRASHALGRHYPGGLEKMVAAMNAKARELGMKNTTYADPTGLSNRNQSTARDMAVLVGAVAKNPLLREYSTTPSHLAALNGRTLQYNNSNRLVRNRNAGWDIELQKTGYIVEAGRCLTMLTRVAGHNLIMVMLDAESNGARVNDAERMRRWVVAQNGWHDELAVANAEAAQARKVKVAANKAEAKRKAAVARKSDKGKEKTAVAKAGSGKAAAGKTASAKAPGKTTSAKAAGKTTSAKAAGKDGRVRQSFAAGRHDPKS
jgi:D-alanyl-D-alanine endopeptidase (penicillin-binding protein 7)